MNDIRHGEAIRICEAIRPGFLRGLAMIEADFTPHYSMYIVTAKGVAGSMLVSEDDARQMLGDQWDEDDADQGGLISDEYIPHFKTGG